MEEYEPDHEKMCLMSYAYNKCADHPAHPRSLISAFVVRCLDSIINVPLDSLAEISRLFASQAGLWSGLVGNSRRHVLSCRGLFGCMLNFKGIKAQLLQMMSIVNIYGKKKKKKKRYS